MAGMPFLPLKHSMRANTCRQLAGRPKVNLELFRQDLTDLYTKDGLSIDELVQYLNEWHSVSIHKSTLKRRLKDWEVRRRLAPIKDPDYLHERIQFLVFRKNLNDEELLQVLQKEGFQVHHRTLVRNRLRLGIRRRRDDEGEEKAEYEQFVRRLLEEELKKGVISGYGKGFIQSHFRQKGFLIARDRLFSIYRTLNPEGVDRRRRKLQMRRGEYVVPGPNFVWSMDGHDKLKPYGIEIYGCIDAYSRYVIWVYVGISNATAVSCFHQFLAAIETEGKQPRFVRSDRGNETTMLAVAHYQLQQDQEPGLIFEDCYLYGTSTANQRIESWWTQLGKQLLYRWRVSNVAG